MKLTNCNCGKKVDCGCVLSFDTYQNNLVSSLSVGNLVGGDCVLDEYVIDWYKNGNKELVSGIGFDPELQAFHPFTIPAESGAWVPVVRYVVIDNVQIYAEQKACKNWCDMPINLPEIILVDRLDCTKNNTALNAQYQWEIFYTALDPNSLPSRAISWHLPDPDGVDGRLKHFGVLFRAYDVVDEVEVLFNGVTSLARWQVGGNTAGGFSSRFLTKPYRRVTTGDHQFVIAVPTDYVEGDYLVIKVTPSVMQPSVTQTNWLLRLHCIPNSVDFDCQTIENLAALRAVDISNWSFVDDTQNCRRLFSASSLNPWPLPWADWNSTSNPFFRWCSTAVVNSVTLQDIATSGHMRVGLVHEKQTMGQNYSVSQATISTPSAGLVTLNKTGTVFTFTFESQTDYNTVISHYNESLSSVWWTNKSTDPTDIRYYRWWRWNWRSRPINCGDTQFALRDFYFHWSSDIVFDDTNGVYTLTITPAIVANQWSAEPCNNAVGAVNSYIAWQDNTANLANFTETTYCFEWKMLGYCNGFLEPTVLISTNTQAGMFVLLYGRTHPCMEELTVACETSENQILVYLFLPRVIINLTVDGNGNWQDGRNPLENFTLYNTIGGNNCTPASEMLLQVVDGVQVYP